MHQWLLGWRTLADLRRTDEVRLIGPIRLAKAFPGWFAPPPFARSLRVGRERTAVA